MTAAGDRRRELIGPAGEAAALEAALSAPAPSQALLDRLAVLLRTLRRKPHTPADGHGDVA